MRAALAALALAALGLLLSGCGRLWAHQAEIRSPNPISHYLQRQVLYVVDGHGLPVDYDFVGCQGPSPSGLVHCYAQTTADPAGAIVGSFAVHRSANGCPGTLTVKMSGAFLGAKKVNPCKP